MNGIHLENQRSHMIRKTDYQKYADCILMEQMSAPEISELFEDKEFYNWYRVKYLRDGSRRFSRTRRNPKASPMPQLPN